MEISITKALRELKTLDGRILKKISDTTFVSAKKPKETLRGFKTVEDFEKEAKENLQSIKDLIAYRKHIKKAIVESNASTEVTIANETMTVADAIERKNFIEIEKTLLNKILNNFSHSYSKVELDTEKSENILNNQLTGMLSKDGKTDTTALEGYKKLFWDTEKSVLIDPLNAKKITDEMSEKIQSFEDDVDVALSEINARTIINVGN